MNNCQNSKTGSIWRSPSNEKNHKFKYSNVKYQIHRLILLFSHLVSNVWEMNKKKQKLTQFYCCWRKNIQNKKRENIYLLSFNRQQNGNTNKKIHSHKLLEAGNGNRITQIPLSQKTHLSKYIVCQWCKTTTTKNLSSVWTTHWSVSHNKFTHVLLMCFFIPNQPSVRTTLLLLLLLLLFLIFRS